MDTHESVMMKNEAVIETIGGDLGGTLVLLWGLSLYTLIRGVERERRTLP